ncbi:hypothetical protein WN943_008764 [Citrus x changshan-huyou]
MDLVSPPVGRGLGAHDARERIPLGGRRRSAGWQPGKLVEVEGVKATEATESQDHGSQLLGSTPNVSEVAGADQLPEALVLSRLVPELVDAGRPRQSPGVRVFQHLEQKVLVQICEASFFGLLSLFLLLLLLLLFDFLHLLLVFGGDRRIKTHTLHKVKLEGQRKRERKWKVLVGMDGETEGGGVNLCWVWVRELFWWVSKTTRCENECAFDSFSFSFIVLFFFSFTILSLSLLFFYCPHHLLFNCYFLRIVPKLFFFFFNLNFFFNDKPKLWNTDMIIALHMTVASIAYIFSFYQLDNLHSKRPA